MSSPWAPLTDQISAVQVCVWGYDISHGKLREIHASRICREVTRSSVIVVISSRDLKAPGADDDLDDVGNLVEQATLKRHRGPTCERGSRFGGD